MFHEGKLSELSALGPNVTNFFKFVKWLIWLFAVLTVVDQLDERMRESDGAAVDAGGRRLLVPDRVDHVVR